MAWVLTTEPVGGNEIVLTACSAEHLRLVRTNADAEATEQP